MSEWPRPAGPGPVVALGKLVADQKGKVNGFVRMEVGEGIEKKSEDFAEEVRKASKV